MPYAINRGEIIDLGGPHRVASYNKATGRVTLMPVREEKDGTYVDDGDAVIRGAVLVEQHARLLSRPVN